MPDVATGGPAGAHPNLPGDLRAAARAVPGKPALVARDGAVTYAALDGDADRLAGGVHRLGIRPRDRVVFAVGNRPEFAVLLYGTLRAGAVAVPLSPRLKAPELRACIIGADPRAIVAEESAAGEVMSAGPHPVPVFVVGRHPTARPYVELLAGAAPMEAPESPDTPAVVLHTPGTTGPPKAVLLSHGNLAASIEQALALGGATTGPGDVVLGVVPVWQVWGLVLVLALAVRQGATVVMEERFDPAASLRVAAAAGATVLVGSPPMLRAWAATAQPHDLGRVRVAVSVAAPLPAEVAASFRAVTGVEVWQTYGLTEAGPAVAASAVDGAPPGSVGRPVPGVEARVVGEDGRDVVPGDPGELWLRGDGVARGYRGDDATAAGLPGGWLRTGDVAYRDEEGFLWLLDREPDTIAVSGFRVYPAEVEDVLRRHPAVADAAVVGEPDPERGQRVAAFVVPAAERWPGAEELAAHCARFLARFKVPSRFERVDRVPRLDTGKLVRRMLRRQPRAAAS